MQFNLLLRLMVLQAEQFVTHGKSKRAGVLLDPNNYNRLREEEEELTEVRAYAAAGPKVVADVKAGRFATWADYRDKCGKANTA